MARDRVIGSRTTGFLVVTFVALNILLFGWSTTRRTASDSADASFEQLRVGGWQEDLASGVLALIRFPWDDRGYSLQFATALSDSRAQVSLHDKRITVFLSESDIPDRVVHEVVHEIGHVYDYEHLDGSSRRAYLAARGARGAPWFPARGDSDYATGSGDFAEVFAACYSSSPVFRSTLAAAPADPCSVLPVIP